MSVIDIALLIIVVAVIMIYTYQRQRLIDEQAALLERERVKIRLIIDTVPSFIFITDENMNILLANVSFANMFNVKFSDMIGKPLTTFINDPVTILKLQNDVVTILLKNITEHGGELMLRHPQTGEKRYYNLSRSVFHNGHKGVITIANDITTLKAMIDVLRVTQQHYADLIESSSNLILQISPEMTILYSNATSRKHIGYDPSECIGLSWIEIIDQNDRAYANKQFVRWSNFATKSEERWECAVITRTGIIKTFLWDITIIWREDIFIGLQMNGIDITAKSQQEFELRKAKIDLSEINKKLLAEQTRYREIVQLYELMVKTSLNKPND